MSYIRKAMKRDVNGRTRLQVINSDESDYQDLKITDISNAALEGTAGDILTALETADGNVVQALADILTQLVGDGNGITPVQVTGGVVIDGDTTLAGTVVVRDGTDAGKTLTIDSDGYTLVRVDGGATEDKQDELAALVGEVDADPTEYTLLARIKELEGLVASLEGKLDTILDGSTPATVHIAGSAMEYYGADILDRPLAGEVPVGAVFMLVVEETSEDTMWMSDGVDWVVI